MVLKTPQTSSNLSTLDRPGEYVFQSALIGLPLHIQTSLYLEGIRYMTEVRGDSIR